MAQPWAGSGTAEDPYQLWDANDMQAIGADPNYWDAYFRLQADVDMSGYTGAAYNVIGNSTVAFTGVFDGNGHTISNLTYNVTSESYVGLFGWVEGFDAVIMNVQLINPNINAGWGNHVGALVAHLESSNVVKCGVRGGAVSAEHSVGGLVGWASSAYLTYCSSATTVSGMGFFAGGLVASIANGQVSDSYSTSTVTGSSYVGGLIGLTSSNGFINNCYSAGSVSGSERVGAFIGRHWDYGTYNKCFWDSTVNPSLEGISNKTDPNVIGLPTTLMKQMATFTDAGWDFVGESINGNDDIWEVCEGIYYPRLVWESDTSGYDYIFEINADDPLIYFRFEEDDIAHNVNVVNSGSFPNLPAKYIGVISQPRYAPGKVGKGVFFDNQANGAIVITSPAYTGSGPSRDHIYALTPGDMTVEVWFRSGYGSAYYEAGTEWDMDYPRLFSNGNGEDGMGAARVYFGAGQYGIGAGIKASGDNPYRDGYMWPYHPGWDPNFDPNHNTGPADNQWHHAVMTIDTNDTGGADPNTDPPLTVEFYLDGALLGSKLFEPADPNATGILGPEHYEFLIGADGDYGNRYNDFYGTFDEFAIYSYVLPVDRIIVHYQEGLTSTTWVPENCAQIFEQGWNMPADLNKDCRVNFLDIADMGKNWWRCMGFDCPGGADCDPGCETPWLD